MCLSPVRCSWTSWAPQRTRNSSLRVDSSPTRSARPLSWGSRPASVRSMATVSPAAGAARGVGGAGEIEQVFALGLVEVQGPAERLKHALGDPGKVAALELRVVLDADSGQVGDLAAAQTGHAAVAAVVRQPGLLGGDLGPAGAEEGLDLVAVAHASRLGAVPRMRGGLSVHRLAATSPRRRQGVTWNPE